MRSTPFWIAAALAALAAYLLSDSMFVVSEGQQALVVRLGAPVAEARTPGLRFKAPLIDSVYAYDTRLLLLEAPIEQVILGDQKRLEVQPFVRYRIVDPLRFQQALRTVEAARAQLGQLVGSSVRRELGQTTLARLLTPERAALVQAIRKEVRAEAEPLGLEIDEVLFHRADLPPETSQAIYDRMKSERLREAKELRAQGFEWAQQIQVQADHDRTVLMSQAQQAATIARGEGDAEASRRVAAAYGADPKFYEFYRAAQTYRTALARPQTTLVVSPDARFLGLLLKGPEAPGAKDAEPAK
jgi:membrane protease subunit HflC